MKTPKHILGKFEQEAQGLDYGTVTLTLHIKQGKPRYIIAREESYIPSGQQATHDYFSAKEKLDGIKETANEREVENANRKAPDLAAWIAENNRKIREFFYS